MLLTHRTAAAHSIMTYQPNSNRFKFELESQQVADLLNAFKVHDAEKRHT